MRDVFLTGRYKRVDKKASPRADMGKDRPLPVNSIVHKLAAGQQEEQQRTPSGWSLINDHKTEKAHVCLFVYFHN